jgi:hypothetical protein
VRVASSEKNTDLSVAAERESGIDLKTVQDTEQVPAASAVPTNNEKPQPPALPARLDGISRGKRCQLR